MNEQEHNAIAYFPQPTSLAIDCNADPIVYTGRIHNHQRNGRIKEDDFGVKRVTVQERPGRNILRNIEHNPNEPVMNACMLNAYVEHPYLYPDAFKMTAVGFPVWVLYTGTVFESDSGIRYVLATSWDEILDRIQVHSVPINAIWHTWYFLATHVKKPPNHSAIT